MKFLLISMYIFQNTRTYSSQVFEIVWYVMHVECEILHPIASFFGYFVDFERVKSIVRIQYGKKIL